MQGLLGWAAEKTGFGPETTNRRLEEPRFPVQRLATADRQFVTSICDILIDDLEGAARRNASKYQGY